ncbi:MAG TPA: dienelactone hydrolase family protein [Ilumatobacteraceae bacterium]
MHIANIEYTVDGTHMLGHLATDDSRHDTRPGVLVCHEGPGMSDHTKNIANRLGALGYVTFALDYHGGGTMLARDQMMSKLGGLMGDHARIARLGQSGLDILLAQEHVDPTRIAAIGYCFGGTMALEMGRSGAALNAIVGFHSGLGTKHPEDAQNITGTVLVNIGADDPMIPAEQRQAFEQEMRAGGVDWRMNLYGGAQHSFTNPAAAESGMPGVVYNESADRRSWAAMLSVFDECFNSSDQ